MGSVGKGRHGSLGGKWQAEECVDALEVDVVKGMNNKGFGGCNKAYKTMR